MVDDDNLLVIATDGDLILEACQKEDSQRYAFRVDSKTLSASSRYFENLLSDRFREGQRLLTELAALKIAGHANMGEVPADALPRISIVNFGRIAVSKGSSIKNLAADFLRAAHGQELAVATPPVSNLANLVVVADRFDAVKTLREFIRRKKYVQLIDAKSKGGASTALPEERVRQKLLIGLLCDHPPWVTRNSKHLILRDSARWRPGVEVDHSQALWWDLPNGIEDELIQRREYILETINSLQAHFLKLYTSGERQCKMGYDTSIQCDSFQLGEMIRFFSKLSTLRLQGTIYDNTEPSYYSGDVDRLLESLRQCPSYQIDVYHSHCGLRARFIPLLDLIQNQLSLDTGSLDVGICAECWKHSRSLYAWSSAKRPVVWAHPKSLVGSRTLATAHFNRHDSKTNHCLSRHMLVRDMFMAVDKDWTARDGY